MISNTDNQTKIERRNFLGKMMAIGGLGLVLGKLMPKTAHANVDSKYTNNLPKELAGGNH